MLYLALVQKNYLTNKIELQTLAYEKSPNIWEVKNSQTFPLNTDSSLNEGVLVLVEADNNNEILSIQDSKDWILGILQQYLTENAISPEFVEAEQSKIEKWRQEVTTQNLELNQRLLEIETRREELQQLEQSLKKENDNPE